MTYLWIWFNFLLDGELQNGGKEELQLVDELQLRKVNEEASKWYKSCFE